MFRVKRNQVIVTALVVMIAVAGYLSYTDVRDEQTPGFAFNEDNNIEALVPNSHVFDQTVMVHAPNVTIRELTNTEVVHQSTEIALALENNMANNQEDDEEPPQEGEQSAQETTQPQASPGEAMLVSANIDSGTFFVQAKLDREQSRSRQKEILMSLINNTNLDEVSRATSADAVMSIQSRIEKESSTESLIEARGFREVFVRIDDNMVDVVVSKEVLSDAEIAQIEDIVKRKTGMDSGQIRISPMSRPR